MLQYWAWHTCVTLSPWMEKMHRWQDSRNKIRSITSSWSSKSQFRSNVRLCPSVLFGLLESWSHLIHDNIWCWLLTADVQVYGVAPLPVRVLKAAVQSVVAQVHFGQDEPGSLQVVLGLHVRPVHLPRHRRVIVQRAALHGDITAHSLVLVPSNWKRTEVKIKSWWLKSRL